MRKVRRLSAGMAIVVDQSAKEPLWTGQEIEKFWVILQPYMERLIRGQLPLPECVVDLEWCKFDRSSHKDRQTCLCCVQELMWNGKYSEATALLKKTLNFYDADASNKGARPDRIERELQLMRSLFANQRFHRVYGQSDHFLPD
ncbi:uncharacterized protein [Ptychodera flava]|uniref:uncharacterized protein n=1 Tax=Ptychodera flava TaxID=63121 RepID=UPI00396A193A